MAKGVDPALIGRTIATKFTIESYIGAGAMGAVYKARQLALDKIVAVKILHRELTSDEAFSTRFKREAKAASRLDHPNSVRIIDFGVEPDGTMYIAMELLDGRDLLHVLVEDWPLSPGRSAGLVMQVLAALSVAHDLGVIHRDLKPENIMILAGRDDEGEPTDIVKVCDFGIAKMTALRSDNVSQGGGPLTGQGLVVGTPEYMSPEQGRGDPLDHRSDLYSVGVILFQLLTGRVPFDAESALGIVFKHVMEEPPRPSSINPNVDPRLEAICLKAMRKRREDRPQSAREMRAELRPILGSKAVFGVGTPSGPALLGTDDTAPMPLLTPDASARALPDRAAVPASSAPDRPDPVPKTTSSIGLFDQVPTTSRAPPRALVGFALVALSAVVVAAVAIHRGSARDDEKGTLARATAGEANSARASLDADSSDEAAPFAAVTIDAAPLEPEPPPTGAAKPASRSAHASRGAPTIASGAGSHGKEGFDPATSSASPSVTHAEGATARDVRAALSGARFTQCYRDALTRVGKRLEGTMSVHILMGGDGRVTTALVSAPESLAQGVGRCITESFNQLPIANVAATGGSADIAIVFAPD